MTSPQRTPHRAGVNQTCRSSNRLLPSGVEDHTTTATGGERQVTAQTIDQLRSAGLLAGAEPHLTAKGKMWLRALEVVDSSEEPSRRPQTDDFLYLPDALDVTGPAADDEDFVLSCSGLLR